MKERARISLRCFHQTTLWGGKKNHDFLRVHIEIVIFYQKSLSQENHLVKKVTTILEHKTTFYTNPEGT